MTTSITKPCSQPECPLFTDGVYVPGSGDGNIFLVGEYPSISDTNRNQPFTGQSGQLLDDILSITGMGREQFYMTNAIKCYHPSRHKTEDITPYCCHNLAAEIATKKPQHVLNLGTAAQMSIDQRKVGAVRGFVRDATISDHTFQQLGTYNPAACFKKPEHFDLLIYDFKKFNRLISGKYTEEIFDVEVVSDIVKLNSIVDEFSKLPMFSLDIETRSFDLGEPILCVQLGHLRKAYVIPYSEDVKEPLTRLFMSDALKLGQNILFDLAHLRYNDINTKGPYFDTMMAHHLICTYLSHGLETIASIYTNLPEWDTAVRDIIGHGKNATFDKIPKDILYQYAGIDVIATYLSTMKLRKEIRQKNLDDLMTHLSHTIQTVLDIRMHGIRIDTKKLPEIQKALDTDIQKAQLDIYKLAKGEFNINSPKQLSNVLYNILHLPSKKRTKSGAPSTDKGTLEVLRERHKIIPQILDYRSLSKVRSTFVSDKLITKLDKNDRLHTTYKPTGTVTLRMSSENPNLQNIPRKAYIRQLFCAAPGYKFIEADYSQAELRVAAHLASDSDLQYALDTIDVHRTVAANIFKKPIEEITSEERVMAKFVVFGFLYGRGADSVAAQFKIPLHEAEKIMQGFYTAYSAVAQWLKAVVNNARQHRMLKTPYGFSRKWPIYGEFLPAWEREARNLIPQNIVGCKTVEAMNVLHSFFKEANLDAHIIMNVHDSLSFEIRDNIVMDVLEVIKTVMEQPVKNLPLILPTDIQVGDRWYDDNSFNYKDGKLSPRGAND